MRARPHVPLASAPAGAQAEKASWHQAGAHAVGPGVRAARPPLPPMPLWKRRQPASWAGYMAVTARGSERGLGGGGAEGDRLRERGIDTHWDLANCCMQLSAGPARPVSPPPACWQAGAEAGAFLTALGAPRWHGQRAPGG